MITTSILFKNISIKIFYQKKKIMIIIDNFGFHTIVENSSFLNFPKPVRSSHVSSEGSQDRPTPTSLHTLGSKERSHEFLQNEEKEKRQKDQSCQEKARDCWWTLHRRGLWTAGGNIVDAITKDSSATQISANEVNYVEDKTKALLEIKTNQRDSISTFPWYILGYILLGLGMILMAIPALRLLRWIKASCGSGNDSQEKENTEEQSATVNKVIYHPDHGDKLEFGQNQPKTSLSQKMKMLEQEAQLSMENSVM